MTDLPDEVLHELLQSFHIEAVEHLQTLNQSLLKLERAADEKRRQALVQDAFRAAHSLKGAARAVDAEQIGTLAHSLESILQQARSTDATIEASVCDVLYGMLDAIQAALDGQEIDISAFQARLAAVTDTEPVTAAPPLSEALAEERPEETGFRVISDDTIRVAVSKLDTLMAQSGELVISKISAEQRLSDLQIIHEQLAQWPRTWREIQAAVDHLNGSGGRLKELLGRHHERLQAVTRSLDTLERALRSDTIRLGMTTADLQADVRRVRMLPLQTITLGLERAVRDTARVEGKQVDFSVEGGEVELDKKVLETLKDPLLHLLRNAVGHGIETPDVRRAAGKAVEGHVRLTVRQRGNEVSLAVADDGRGFDLEALRQAGRNGSNRILEDAIAEDILSLAFLPGITTSPQVTAISGRGVGLDVVRQRIEAIHGRIVVDNVPGEGASIELIVPTSLAMTRGLLVRVGTERFALPMLSIERIVDGFDTFSIGGKQMIRMDDTPLPLVSLSAILERPPSPSGTASAALAVILSVAEQRLAIQVDDIVTELELAVKPIGDPLRRVRNVTGAALMGNGEPVVVLNPSDLIRSARGAAASNIQLGGSDQDKNQPIVHILVVDDSITTRTLEKNILEAAGYHVTTAINGLEALKRLEEQPIDLVVTDIQMPNLDGFGLTRQIREHPEHSRLPIILVTSLESQEDREQGMEAGADAYIIKRGFNQANLLTTIKQFLNGTD
ncbi:MAG: response regulator [Anaerolineae bacterium]|nr:response regulator [Anaerolineae bacterium]